MAKKTNSQQIAEVLPTTETAAPVIKVTPVEERLFELAVDPSVEQKFRGKQRQITFDSLKSSPVPLSIDDIAKIAEEAGLKAKGGVAPSVRYHMHFLTKDGFTKVTNPTIVIE
jgi:hypothetical protein